MYFVKTPSYLKRLFSGLTWDVNSRDEVFLTFDDGPVPGVTDKVLDILQAYHCKATFFCIGDNVRKHPELFQRILDEGHEVGNHTFHHVNGWKTRDIDYLQDITACATLVKSNLFRPPYGRIGYKQINLLKKQYRIVMWDVLSGDFDEELTTEDCYQNVIRNARPGSIIVFHDSIKAAPRMIPALEKYIYSVKNQVKFGILG
jgi:peptidoglycan/xylan/chitin deacetylase (PgdA/CDA1 family)